MSQNLISLAAVLARCRNKDASDNAGPKAEAVNNQWRHKSASVKARDWRSLLFILIGVKKMKVMHEYGAGIARLSGLESLHGTTVVYIVKGAEVNCYECDYEIQMMVETNKPQLRAVRQQKLDSRTSPGILPHACLQDELGVICGPGLSSESVPELLEALARKIRQRGLVTGHDEFGRLGLERLRR